MYRSSLKNILQLNIHDPRLTTKPYIIDFRNDLHYKCSARIIPVSRRNGTGQKKKKTLRRYEARVYDYVYAIFIIRCMDSIYIEALKS